MKKKIAILAAALMLTASVASGSSINGDYNGNPIVKLKSNGSLVDTGDVPAIIYDGKTMVPIAALRNIGLGVSWNQDEYSVDVIQSIKEPSKHIESHPPEQNINIFLPLVKQVGGKNLKIIFDEYGSYVSVRYDSVNDSSKELDSLVKLAALAGASNQQETRIAYYINGKYSAEMVASHDDALLWIEQKITSQEFSNRIKVTNQESVSSNTTPTPSPATSNTQMKTDQKEVNKAAKCANVNDTYDKNIANLKVEMGARGLLNGSIHQQQAKKINEQRDSELKTNGCI